MRAVAGAALALAVLLFGELVATAVVEQRTSAALCGDVELDLGPWPVTPRLAAERPVTFRGELDADDLAAFVPLPRLVTDVAVTEGQLRLVTSTGLTVPAELALHPDAVVVTPRLGPVDLARFAVRLELDDLPSGITLTAVEVVGEHVVVSGLVAPAELPDGPGTLACPGDVS